MYKVWFLVIGIISSLSCVPRKATVKTERVEAPIDTVLVPDFIVPVETLWVVEIETVKVVEIISAEIETVEVIKEITVSTGMPSIFSVQVGAFKVEENAKRLCQKLRDKFEEEIYIMVSIPFWKVRIGRYDTLQEAAILRDELRVRGFEDAWIVWRE